MASRTEIQATLISALSSLKEGDILSAYELSQETGIHRDCIARELSWLFNIQKLGVQVYKSRKNWFAIKPKDTGKKK